MRYLIIFLLLAGCAGRGMSFEQNLGTLDGISETDLIAAWGEPREIVISDNDTRLLRYKFFGTSSSCQVDFTMTDAGATHAAWRGSCIWDQSSNKPKAREPLRAILN